MFYLLNISSSSLALHLSLAHILSTLIYLWITGFSSVHVCLCSRSPCASPHSFLWTSLLQYSLPAWNSSVVISVSRVATTQYAVHAQPFCGLLRTQTTHTLCGLLPYWPAASEESFADPSLSVKCSMRQVDFRSEWRCYLLLCCPVTIYLCVTVCSHTCVQTCIIHILGTLFTQSHCEDMSFLMD